MATLFVEQLTTIDCSYWHPERGLVGETWLVDLELSGSLDDQGMIFDFGQLKRQAKRALEDRADHKFLVPELNEAVRVRAHAGHLHLTLESSGAGRMELRCPESALCLIAAPRVDAETLRSDLNARLVPLLPKNVDRVSLGLRTETESEAYYQYSHGLKKHDGHCQRIAHGHRSRLVIHENGARNRHWERSWADRWRDIYLGSSTDCTPGETPERLRFSYRAAEGEFALELDRRRCYVMEQDTTVECIAQHIADKLKAGTPGSTFTVRAYEGVNKGAIAHSA